MATSGWRSIDALIARMQELSRPLAAAGDRRRFFHDTYLRTTLAVKDELARGGFVDPDWTQAWDVRFAELYLDAFEQWNRNERPSRPWVICFEAAAERLPPLRHVLLGLCMAVACFSLIGIPLTVGFLGKVLLIKPALAGHNNWLVVLTVINAAISAAYYLRIVGTLVEPPNAPAKFTGHATIDGVTTRYVDAPLDSFFPFELFNNGVCRAATGSGAARLGR